MSTFSQAGESTGVNERNKEARKRLINIETRERFLAPFEMSWACLLSQFFLERKQKDIVDADAERLEPQGESERGEREGERGQSGSDRERENREYEKNEH